MLSVSHLGVSTLYRLRHGQPAIRFEHWLNERLKRLMFDILERLTAPALLHTLYEYYCIGLPGSGSGRALKCVANQLSTPRPR